MKMKNDIKNQDVRVYQTPIIEKIMMDNEISLVLASDPPTPPGEVKNNLAPDYFNNDPFGNKA